MQMKISKKIVFALMFVCLSSVLLGSSASADTVPGTNVNVPNYTGTRTNVGGNAQPTVGGNAQPTIGNNDSGFRFFNNPGTSAGGSKFRNPIKASNLNALLVDFLRVITMLGAIVVVIFFILAGFKYVTARGDEKQIGEATKALTWTAVGAAVLLGAQVLARVIQSTVSQLG
jgi:hypothetical protein